VKRGDVVLMVAGGDFGKPRPGVVVQADELGDTTTTVLICPVTSDVTENLPVRPIVEAEMSSGLHFRSQIMTDKLSAVPRTRVRRVLGKIGTVTRDQLDRVLLLVLGLAR
jgi:mRNA interferase MazF